MAAKPSHGAKPSKHDVELAKHRVELARLQRSAEIWTTTARGGAAALTVAASSIPLWALQGVVEPLAGKQTVVNANVVISVTIAISVVINLLQAVKGASQKAEIKRQRELITELEARLLQ